MTPKGLTLTNLSFFDKDQFSSDPGSHLTFFHTTERTTIPNPQWFPILKERGPIPYSSASLAILPSPTSNLFLQRCSQPPTVEPYPCIGISLQLERDQRSPQFLSTWGTNSSSFPRIWLKYCPIKQEAPQPSQTRKSKLLLSWGYTAYCCSNTLHYVQFVPGLLPTLWTPWRHLWCPWSVNPQTYWGFSTRLSNAFWQSFSQNTDKCAFKWELRPRLMHTPVTAGAGKEWGPLQEPWTHRIPNSWACKQTRRN